MEFDSWAVSGVVVEYRCFSRPTLSSPFHIDSIDSAAQVTPPRVLETAFLQLVNRPGTSSIWSLYSIHTGLPIFHLNRQPSLSAERERTPGRKDDLQILPDFT